MVHLTHEEKQLALELYKAHFTANEAQLFFPVGYGTIRSLWRGFEASGIDKYNRLSLIDNSLQKELIAYASKQKTANN